MKNFQCDNPNALGDKLAKINEKPCQTCEKIPDFLGTY